MRRAITMSLGAAVGLLALVGVAASATHYLQEPYNPGFLRYPSVVALHVVLGGVYLALAPFQFVRRIRSKHLAYHRRAGRALVAIGLLVGVTTLFMGLVIPAAGWSERIVIGLFGSVFLVALAKGFLHVRSGRVALHREWMIRAGGCAMSQTSYPARGILNDLIAIERTLWENDAEIYHDRYSPEALLIFPGVGRIGRDTAVAAIRQENAEGRAWAEVRFDDVDGRWITTDAAALITYTATARWNHESTASKTLCASVYVRADGSWRVAFHQQTPI